MQKIKQKNNTTLQNTIYRFTHIHCVDGFCSLFQDDLTGQAILDVCFARLNLIETPYFGLRFLDEENQTVSYSIYHLKYTLFLDYIQNLLIPSFDDCPLRMNRLMLQRSNEIQLKLKTLYSSHIMS